MTDGNSPARIAALNLTIRGRLLAIVGLSLLPTILLGYLFFAQSEKDIDFGTKEIVGARYFAALAPDLAALSRASAVPASSAFDAARGEFDGELGTAPLAEAYVSAKGSSGASGYSPAAGAALLALLAKIGDASNLILDPDLDSYYVMDMLVTKLPVAFDASGNLREQVASVAAAPNDDGRIVLVAQRGAFDALVVATQSSLASGIAGNGDGKVALALSGPTKDFAAAAADFSAAVKAASAALATGSTTPPDLTKVTSSQVTFISAADKLNGAVNAELTRLLNVRVEGFNARLATMLGISAGLVLLVFATCFVFIRSILGIIGRFQRDVTDVADLKDGAAITHAEARDEIAAIARAVKYLQEKTVERLGAAEQGRAAGLEQASRHELAAARARQENLEAIARTAQEQQDAVAELSKSLHELAAGNLDCSIERPFPGTLDGLRVTFNRAVDDLRRLIGQLRETSSGLRTATSEILSGSNDLAMRTSRQAETIEQTNGAISQIGDAVEKNATLVRDAKANGEVASQTAKATAAALTQASEAMEKIAESSAQISSIIGLIDNIAFQTNLLALNASVEAARAGEAGRGFAVVAVEVRRLAQSAATASNDVKALIEKSGTHVGEGARLVTSTSELLEAMLEATERNSNLVGEIAVHSESQSLAVDTFREAIDSLETMAQHNAALVEETNAAIEQTEGLAGELDALVNRFKASSSGEIAAAA
jgi:methyl-accepting chemotaxis protein